MKVKAKSVIGIVAIIAAIALIVNYLENKKIEAEISSDMSNMFEETRKKVDDEMRNHWHVNTSTDAMTDKSINVATLISQNEVLFDFPYDGGSRMVMNIREKDGKLDIYFKITKGQFVCSEYQGTNNVTIRFGDAEAKQYTTSESATNDSDILFIKNTSAAKEIYNKCLTETEFKVKANFFSEGSRVFNFKVEEPLASF